MSDHDIEDLINKPPDVPWEPKGQVKAKDMPDSAPEGYPAPWESHGRGNGHYDVYDANGKYLIHIYIWDNAEWETFKAKLASINGDV